MNNRHDQLAKTSKELMFTEPFYSLFLLGLNKKWVPDERLTAGVSLNGLNYELLLGESFWDSLTLEKRKGLLKHELLHIAMFHLVSFEDLRDLRIRNIAMDIEINQYIDREMLPEGGMFLDTFPELKLEPKKGTRYYYEKLMQSEKAQNCSNLVIILQGEPGQEVEIDGPSGKIKVKIPDHTWEQFEGMSEASKKILERHTETLLKEVVEAVQKSQGTIPGELQEIIKMIYKEEPPKFDWKRYLRMFVGGSIKVYTKKTRRKFNKRYEDNPGIKIKPRQHILVGLDTSGSVSTSELKEFLQELWHIQKTGTTITVAQCDTEIAHVGEFNPRTDYKVHGRGGTDFQPVVDLFNDPKKSYACLIYFTDGECYPPKVRMNNQKILWVISSRSQLNKSLPGKVIKLS